MAENYQINHYLVDKTLEVNHPETNADMVLDTATKRVITIPEGTKLTGIETGAQVNKIEIVQLNGTALTITNKTVNIANVATLDAGGKVPASQLPSYVDDVLEFADKTKFPAAGEAGKIYVAIDTNITYRWGGTAYVEISASLALGETDSTAYAGDKGKKNATAITGLTTRVTAVETANTTQSTDITNIKNGTTTVGKATTATKLATARNISIAGDGTGSATFDGSANASIALTLNPSGILSGTYSAVQVNNKGIAVAGAQMVEWGTAGQATPSASLAIGGLFFKKI